MQHAVPVAASCASQPFSVSIFCLLSDPLFLSHLLMLPAPTAEPYLPMRHVALPALPEPQLDPRHLFASASDPPHIDRGSVLPFA